MRGPLSLWGAPKGDPRGALYFPLETLQGPQISLKRCHSGWPQRGPLWAPRRREEGLLQSRPEKNLIKQQTPPRSKQRFAALPLLLLLLLGGPCLKNMVGLQGPAAGALPSRGSSSSSSSCCCCCCCCSCCWHFFSCSISSSNRGPQTAGELEDGGLTYRNLKQETSRTSPSLGLRKGLGFRV